MTCGKGAQDNGQPCRRVTKQICLKEERHKQGNDVMEWNIKKVNKITKKGTKGKTNERNRGGEE